MLRFFKERMSSNPSQNQGFVIDGYPKTMDQTKSLYEPEEGEEENDAEEEEGPQGPVEHLYNGKIMPSKKNLSLDITIEDIFCFKLSCSFCRKFGRF